MNKIRPFGFRDRIGYLLGDLGNNFTFLLSTVLLMKFYTDVLGIPGGTVGTVMMVARFADGFTDLAMGRICDRSRPTRRGKFKPWILRICVPVAVASFLMYQNGMASAPYGLRVAWLFVTYILWSSVFYTAINIPYGSMASAISRSPEDRQSLSTFRSLGSTFAGLAVGVVIPLFAYVEKDGAEVLDGGRVTVIAAIFSLLAVLCYLLCHNLVTERVFHPETPSREKRGLKKILRDVLRNRPLISIVAASAVMLLARLTMQNMAAYLYPEYYGSAAAQSASTVVMIAGMLLAAAVTGKLSARFGKAEVSAVAAAVAGADFLLLFFLRPQSVWVFIGVQWISWFCLGLFTMMTWAMITDVIDDSQLKFGVREDGLVYSVYSFSRKLGQALAAGVSGWLLEAIGYRTGKDGIQIGQSEEILDGIYNISTLIPALGFFALGLILWFWYPLRKGKVQKNTEALNKERGHSEEGSSL